MSARGGGNIRRNLGPSFRLPLILFVCICGTLVGLRWLKEMKSSHEARKLEVQRRDLAAKVHELERDILDLNGRYADLYTRDAMRGSLAEVTVQLHEERTQPVIKVDGGAVTPDAQANKGGVN